MALRQDGCGNARVTAIKNRETDSMLVASALDALSL
jgi:hypothetical protein